MTSNKKADLKGKKVLFIAYFYPPIASTGVPGAMRTIKFIRNLNNGTYHVLTVHPEADEQNSALSHLTLPVNNEIIHRIKSWDIFKLLLALRTRFKKILGKKRIQQSSLSNSQTTFKSLDSEKISSPGFFQKVKDFIYNLCYFPDQAGPWIFPAYLKGKKLIREHKLDVIFATGSPWSSLIVGYLISKSTGIPLIADLRDPWVNNPFHQSKGEFLDRWSYLLEEKVVKHAAAVSLNTEPLMEDFLERYPNIPADRFFVMPNGFDLTDFKGLEVVAEDNTKNTLTFCHTGLLYGVRDPSVLLDAIITANARLTSHQRFIRFRQIGDVQLSYIIQDRYAAMIEDGSLVLEPPRPYLECLCALSNADWVVNVQPATKSQVPSKLYDYLAINRPILNITPEDGALGRLVTKYKLGELFGFGDAKALSDTLVHIALSHKTRHKNADYPARMEFDCNIIADQLAQRISQLTN